MLMNCVDVFVCNTLHWIHIQEIGTTVRGFAYTYRKLVQQYGGFACRYTKSCKSM